MPDPRHRTVTPVMPLVPGQAETEAARTRLLQIYGRDPRNPKVLMELVSVSAQTGRFVDAEHYCLELIQLFPDHYEPRYHLATALFYQGRLEEAADNYRKALQLRPDSIDACCFLAKCLQLLFRYDEALGHYHAALEMNPNLASVLDSMGSIYKQRGQLEAAIAHYRRGVQAQHDQHTVHSDLLSALNYTTLYDADAVFQTHVEWGNQHVMRQHEPLIHRNVPEPHRRLKIGYVSPDFCMHSVSYFVESFLGCHNKEHFEIYCYAAVSHPDNVTRRMEVVSDHWRDILKLDTKQLVQLIHSDEIDILVDLAGHTANSLLYAFTARPAPVQVTYLGYPNTTGAPAIDYRLTDAWVDPPGVAEAYHTEKLVRLPKGFLCYKPPDFAPDPVPPPAAKNGYVTFASFNNMAKVSPETIDMWSNILKAMPNSRLILKNRAIADKPTGARFAALFEKASVAPERIELEPPICETVDHLAYYGNVDIALDTYPYHGTTTTCEALWMGVPVITLAGQTHVSRVGASLLSQIGLAEFIAETAQAYVEKVVALAGDIGQLTQLRQSIRPRMAASPLCDGAQFAKGLEAAYRVMWEKWCDAQGTAS